MKFGSVCSGIEAASVAWEPLGWKAAWLSEIEPFPCAVLAHHYPDVPNLGDMTTLPERILSGEVEAPDLFCGGTPCQAFSVAGNRQSLDDARGNLSLTFCEIADAIDSVRTTPAIVFWENVPGVLSTKDNAFGCFLGQLAGEDEPLVPSGGKWSNAGYVYGPKRTIAWRVLDAQYFGVAQRRRRVFVVASAREDFCPATVLFESEGVRRDIAPSRETGKDVTVFTPGSIGGCCQGVGTLRANGGDIGGGSEHLVSQPFELGNTLTARMHKGMNSDCNEGQTPVLQPIVLMDQGGSVMNVEQGIVGTLRRETHGHEPAVLQTVFAPAEVGPCMGASGPPYSRTGNERVEAEALAIHNMAVRRLTPVECERLQGFPDEYTNIKDKCPDSPRYKALGNSWAVPVVRWIGERIDALA
jgi:DNA (cytosine-5)-methyltransferase 1